MQKVGLIPFDIDGNDIAILFVTSMGRGRWILPKGNVMKKESSISAVKREAFEEAGIKGEVLEKFATTWPIGKSSAGGVVRIPVTYYPFFVREQMDEWPERHKRQRHWALLKDSAMVVDHDDYAHVLNAFTELSYWIREAAKEYKV